MQEAESGGTIFLREKNHNRTDVSALLIKQVNPVQYFLQTSQIIHPGVYLNVIF